MSIELGKFNQLEVVKEVDFGVYLDGGEEGEILLPTRYVPEDCKIGDFLNVFLYLDMDERLIATTLTPLVQVGQFACLEVSWVNQYGAFLNWGLMKDLFVPFSEQKMKMQVGRKYVVHAHLDEEIGNCKSCGLGKFIIASDYKGIKSVFWIQMSFLAACVLRLRFWRNFFFFRNIFRQYEIDVTVFHSGNFTDRYLKWKFVFFTYIIETYLL